MPFYSNDLSAISAEEEQGAVKIYRKPVAFVVKTEGPIAKLFKLENGKTNNEKPPLKIPLALLKAHFMSWPESKKGQNIYCRAPNLSYAIKIEGPFHIDVLSCDDELTTRKGLPGDYLITKESGENEVCRKEEFEQNFVLSTDWEKMIKASSNYDEDTLSI